MGCRVLAVMLLTIVMVPPIAATPGTFSTMVGVGGETAPARAEVGGPAEVTPAALSRCAALWDVDGDGVDDRLEDLARSGRTPLHAFVDYGRPVGEGDAAALGSLGAAGVYTAPAIDAVCVDALPARLLHAAASLPGVVLVEYAPPLELFLDVSVPAVRGSPSAAYSPHTASELGVTGRGVSIAILDTGVDDQEHDALAGKFIGGADFSGAIHQNNTNPDDENGHGTHCAGTALGTWREGGGWAGVAPEASLLDLKIADGEGEAWSTKLVAALQWCMDNREAYGIGVASVSLGTSQSSDGTDAVSRQVDAATGAGIVVVAAMGNDGGQEVPAPACADTAVAVGAVDDGNTVGRGDDRLASYSNRGPRGSDDDGEDMDELKPDVCAPGNLICAPRFDTVDEYAVRSGTSMSAPHVAGVVALMLEADPSLTPGEMKTILACTAQTVDAPTYPELDPKYNVGYGWGMVDAFGAVRRVMDLSGPHLTGPDLVNASDAGYFEGGIPLTRAHFDTGLDSVTFTFTGPGSWGLPTSVNISGGALKHTVVHCPPREDNGTGTWEMEAQVNYWEVPEATVAVVPRVSFYSRSPDRGCVNSLFTMEVEVDGVGGATSQHVVNGDGSPMDVELGVGNGAFTFSDDAPRNGEVVRITATVRNTGGCDAAGAGVRFTDGPPETGIEIATVALDVPGGGTGEAKAAWTADPGNHTIYVQVDPAGRFPEGCEGDNLARAPLRVLPGRGGNPIFNRPPSTGLESAPEAPPAGMPVTFNATGAQDRDGGAVVWYDFSFGDGTSTGRITSHSAAHVYSTPGVYSASVVVEDNGGASSAPAPALVNVTYSRNGTFDLYLADGGALAGGRPGDGNSQSVPIDGSAGDMVVRTVPVGQWTGGEDAVPCRMFTAGYVEFTSYVHNGGGRTCNYVALDYELKVNNLTVALGRGTGQRIDSGATECLESTVEMLFLEMTAGDVIELEIYAQADVDGLVLLYGGRDHPSGLSLDYYQPPVAPPRAEAGPDLEGYAGQNVTFNGTGEDADGAVVFYEWDFDSDGVVDHQSSASGVAAHAYEVPGQYTATLTVWDDEGNSAGDTAGVSITYRPANAPPWVEVRAPVGNATVRGVITVEGRAGDEVNVTEVEVRVDGGGWDTAEVERGGAHDGNGGVDDGNGGGGGGGAVDAEGSEAAWSFQWDSEGVEDGPHTIEARAFDGELFSPAASVEVNVRNENSPPEIRGVAWDPPTLVADGETAALLTVEVGGPDGPRDIASVRADLEPLGLGERVELRDDGGDGDDAEGDGIYTTRLTVDDDVAPGKVRVLIEAADASGETDRVGSYVEVVHANGAPVITGINITTTETDDGGGLCVVVGAGVEDPDGPDDVEGVWMDLRDMGLSAREDMADDGRRPDSEAGDGVYTLEFVMDPRTAKGAGNITLTAVDADGAEDTKVIEYSVPVLYAKTGEGGVAESGDPVWEREEDGGGGGGAVVSCVVTVIVIILGFSIGASCFLQRRRRGS